MNETQRTLDIEISLRQLRSHQTVLSLKLNSDYIDDPFMSFVSEKHQRVIEEIQKVLNENTGISSISQVAAEFENLEISQKTPAFSAAKSFAFKENEICDREVSEKIHEILRVFDGNGVNELIEEHGFLMKFPKISESLKRFAEVIKRAKTGRKSERMQEIVKRIDENALECEKNEKLQGEVRKTLALRELHLNLLGLPKKSKLGVESVSVQTTENATENHFRQVETLEFQLKNLQNLLSSMKSEKKSIEKCQQQLIEQLTHKKPSESTVFYKERFESTSQHLINLQDEYKKLSNKYKLQSSHLSRNLYSDQSSITKTIESSRFLLSSLIQILEESRLSPTSALLDHCISELHQISLNLISTSQDKNTEKTQRPLLAKVRSESASQRLDFYLLNH